MRKQQGSKEGKGELGAEAGSAVSDKGGEGRVREKVRKVEKTGKERLERKAGKGQYDENRYNFLNYS